MMIDSQSLNDGKRTTGQSARAWKWLSLFAALVVSGCGTTQTVRLIHYEHEDPVREYMLNWQPERDYRPGFASTGADTEPTLAHMIIFYGQLSQVKDLILEGRHREARQILQRMQRMGLPLERDNIQRMLAIIGRQLEQVGGP